MVHQNQIDHEDQNNQTQTETQQAWWHSTVAGLGGGFAGGYGCYIFEGMKKRAQSDQRQPSVRQPNELFRGANSFALSLAPVSMVQVMINEYVTKCLPENHSSHSENLIGVISGSCGAFVSAPVEHIILTQQKQKIGPVAAIKYLWGQGYGYAWTGLKPLLFREAGFGFTMLTGADAAGEWLKTTFNKDLTLPAAIGVGIIGAALTHPFDVTATKKQLAPKPITMRMAMKQIYQAKGWKGFFAGYSHRVFLFTGCMIVIGKTEKAIQNRLTNLSNMSIFSASNKQTENDRDNEHQITRRR